MLKGITFVSYYFEGKEDYQYGNHPTTSSYKNELDGHSFPVSGGSDTDIAWVPR
jgi:hypothetical protein